jgi:hypothetical protein
VPVHPRPRCGRSIQSLGPMATSFVRLNDGWNAEPNAPEPTVERVGPDLALTFAMNAFQFPQYEEGSRGQILFRDCWRYRLGATNDEGWYMGQCRFSQLVPGWGEFYQVVGDLLLESAKLSWLELAIADPASKHYLFYFRDETFECDARSFDVLLPPRSQPRTNAMWPNSSLERPR